MSLVQGEVGRKIIQRSRRHGLIQSLSLVDDGREASQPWSLLSDVEVDLATILKIQQHQDSVGVPVYRVLYALSRVGEAQDWRTRLLLKQGQVAENGLIIRTPP